MFENGCYVSGPRKGWQDLIPEALRADEFPGSDCRQHGGPGGKAFSSIESKRPRVLRWCSGNHPAPEERGRVFYPCRGGQSRVTCGGELSHTLSQHIL